MKSFAKEITLIPNLSQSLIFMWFVPVEAVFISFTEVLFKIDPFKIRGMFDILVSLNFF